MRATELISLAVKISRARDKARRNELAATCPPHLRDLLRSNLSLIRIGKQLKEAKRIANQRKADYRHTYKFSLLPETLQNKPKTALRSTALGNCQAMRELIGGSK